MRERQPPVSVLARNSHGVPRPFSVTTAGVYVYFVRLATSLLRSAFRVFRSLSGLLLATASQVCFTLLTLMGFALQGFVPLR